MEIYSNKRQRREDCEGRSFVYSVLFFLACLALIALVASR